MRNTLAQIDLNEIQRNALQTGDNNFQFANASIGFVVGATLPYIFFIAGISLLIYFIIAGFKFMFSQGDPKALADGKAKMTNAIIGFIIVFMSYWIVQLIGQFLGLADITRIFRGIR